MDDLNNMLDKGTLADYMQIVRDLGQQLDRAALALQAIADVEADLNLYAFALANEIAVSPNSYLADNLDSLMQDVAIWALGAMGDD